MLLMNWPHLLAFSTFYLVFHVSMLCWYVSNESPLLGYDLVKFDNQ